MKNQLVGYARVSSVGQSLDIQLEKLKEFGCDKIFYEKASGVNTERPEFEKCISYVREGDSLVITKLDRMARSSLHLGKLVEQFKSKDINFVVLDQNIDTSSAQGMLMFQMLSSFAEFENELRKERQKEGIKKALDNGIKFGRPTTLTKEVVDQVKQDINSGKYTVRQMLEKNNIARRAFYSIKNSVMDNDEAS